MESYPENSSISQYTLKCLDDIAVAREKCWGIFLCQSNPEMSILHHSVFIYRVLYMKQITTLHSTDGLYLIKVLVMYIFI